MRAFIATVAAGLALAAATVHHADPAGHFNRAPYRFDRNWEEPRVLVYPYDPDERALRAAQIRVIKKPDLVLMGSSRMMPVGARLFRSGLGVFNAGLAGASAQDYAALWQALSEAGKTPSYLIIYADPWIFNRNSGQFRWRANSALFDRFRLSTGGCAPWLWRASSLWQELCRWDTLFGELLNGPVLLEAGKTLWSGRAAAPAPRFVREGEEPLGRALGWRADGSVRMGWTPRPLSEIRELAGRFAGETEVFSLGRYELDSSAVSLLDAVIDEAARARTEVMLVVLPYHKEALSVLAQRPQYQGLIEGFARRLRGRSGFALCEAQDPEASGCTELEFEDGMHPLESCHEKILRRCLAGEPWQGLLPVAGDRPAPVVADPKRMAPAVRKSVRPVPAELPIPQASVAPALPVKPASEAVEWVSIPGGSFMMGAPDLGAAPVHRVTVKAFELAKTLVTVAQYRACVRAGRCTEPGRGPQCNWGRKDRESHPVNCVDWGQAKAFSEWAGGRLPSEAEWEYAARSAGRDWRYPWGNEEATCERAAMERGEGCGSEKSWPVCSRPKGNSAQGLCDMAGNVWEWVQDAYHDSYEGAPADGGAWERPPHPQRVFRGGSWLCTTSNARVDVRSAYVATDRDYRLGFRPARAAR